VGCVVIKSVLLVVLFMQGCSTIDSFADDSTCKATIDFECKCDCAQDSVVKSMIDEAK